MNEGETGILARNDDVLMLNTIYNLCIKKINKDSYLIRFGNFYGSALNFIEL